MRVNVGSTDAAIRWMLAILLFLLSLGVPGVLPSLLIALAALGMAASAATHHCPLYALLHVDTLEHAAAPPRPRAS